MVLPKPSPLAYAVAALAVLLVAALVYISHLRNAARAAARNAEFVSLQAKGLLVASGEKQSQLKADITQMQAQFSELRAALAKAQARTPATKIVEVTKFISDPALVVYEPREAGEACVLAGGDTGQVRIAEIRLQTKLGNIIALGVAEAWRMKPLPEVKLFSSAFETDASAVHSDIKALDNALPGWGGGPWVQASKDGWGLGPIVQTPEAAVWFFKVKGAASFVVGPNGYVAGGAGAIFR